MAKAAKPLPPRPVQKKKPLLDKSQIYNLGAGAVLLVGLGMAIKSSLQPAPETPLCETRYASGVLFSFAQKKGDPFSPEDLQARLGGLDRGLVKNARIVPDESVAFGYALEVTLKRSAQGDDDQSRSGVGFTWLPRQLPTAKAACLSYSVWTPANFKFGDGGVLPGFSSDGAAVEPAPATDKPATSSTEGEQPPAKLEPFFVKPQWRFDGNLETSQWPNAGHRGVIGLHPAKALLKPGQWVRVETEIVLNDPGQPNGILRVWVDGKIVDERFDLAYRKDELQSLQAIVGDVHNLRQGEWAASPVDTSMRISPLELRVQ